MKTVKSILTELIVPFIVAWFFMSILVDIVAIPAVFKNISNMQEGGKIGMTVFGRFNCFEVFLALFIFLGVLSRNEKSKTMLAFSIILLFFSFFYTFYMTPTIADAANRMHQINIHDPAYEIAVRHHRHFHGLYRYFEYAKFILLLVFASYVIRFNIQRTHKEHV